MTATDDATTRLTVDFAGELFPLRAGETFTVGREGDLGLDDNRFLHRRFLTLTNDGALWWLSNVGSRLSATITDTDGRFQAVLAPGARLPVVFPVVSVVFSAGPTTYELSLRAETPAFQPVPESVRLDGVDAVDGESTIGAVPLTPSQRLLILALAEPVLRREGTGMSELPTSAKAAQRLGWTLTRFNRKLDNVCDKLDRQGVPGLRGGVRSLATNRRVRLVEHAVSSRLVRREDLPLLDAAHEGDRPVAEPVEGPAAGRPVPEPVEGSAARHPAPEPVEGRARVEEEIG